MEGDRQAQRAFLSCPHEALGPGPDPCILACSVQQRDPRPETQQAQFHATETLGKSQPSLSLHFPICSMGTGPWRRGNRPLSITPFGAAGMERVPSMGWLLPLWDAALPNSCPPPPGSQPPPAPQASRLDIRTQERPERKSDSRRVHLQAGASGSLPTSWSPLLEALGSRPQAARSFPGAHRPQALGLSFPTAGPCSAALLHSVSPCPFWPGAGGPSLAPRPDPHLGAPVPTTPPARGCWKAVRWG